MKGYTIQNSINLLEKNAKGGGSGGSTSAANVTFDNTQTALVATNVQGALDEVVDMIKALPTLSDAETPIYKIGDDVVYRKVIDFGALPNNTDKTVDHGIANYGTTIYVKGMMYTSAVASYGEDLTGIARVDSRATGVKIATTADYSTYTAKVTIYYTKTSEAKKTRKK